MLMMIIFFTAYFLRFRCCRFDIFALIFAVYFRLMLFIFSPLPLLFFAYAIIFAAFYAADDCFISPR